MKGGEGMADWDITQLDVLEHDTTNGTFNSLVQIDDTHFMLAYAGTDSDGFIKTFSVNLTTGAWTEIDVLEYDAANGTNNSLIKISATKYALAYTGADNDGFIGTFSIDANADNITAIDLLEYDTTDGWSNSLVLIDSTHLILAYSGSGNDGYLKTFSIDANADNITNIHTLEHDTTQGYNNSLVKIDATHYALAYSGSENDGYLKTILLNGSNQTSVIDVLEHDTSNGTGNGLALVDATHLILGYNGGAVDGVRTFSIDANFDNITTIDTESIKLNVETSIQQISSTHYLIECGDGSLDGFIYVVSIDANANNITVVSSLEHDIAQSGNGSLVYDDGKAFLAYAGVDTAAGTTYDGFVKTFSIALPSASTNVTIEGVIGESTASGGTHVVSTYAILPTVSEQEIPDSTGWMCWNVTNNVIDALYNGSSTLNVIIADSVESEGESLIMNFNSLNLEANKPRLTIDNETTTASQATYISNAAKTTNYSTEDYLTIDAGAATKTRILLQFSLEGITTVGTAILCLYYVVGATNARGRPIKLAKVTQPNWVDDTATWSTYDGDNPWIEEGGDSTEEGEWGGSPAFTLPTRNSWNRRYVFRNLPHRWS